MADHDDPDAHTHEGGGPAHRHRQGDTAHTHSHSDGFAASQGRWAQQAEERISLFRHQEEIE